MDATYIKPFIEAVRFVFSTMMKLDVRLGKPFLTPTLPRHDVSGIIGMSGDVVGSVVLSFPTEVARTTISKFVGSPCEVGSADFADALGELVNMISGSAKAKFEGKHVSISTPSVVVGPGHTIARPSGTVCVSLPCSSENGEFSIDIAIREEKRPAA